MESYLIVLDGARGAGKSTVSSLLAKQLDNVVVVGLDMIRQLMSKSRAHDDYNALAFDAIYALTRSFLSNGVSVVIDSGLTMERVDVFKGIASDANVSAYLYALDAPKEVLWERIQSRGEARGKMPNPERFEYTYQKQQDKDFSDFTIIDTEHLMPKEIAQKIVADIQ